MNVDRLEAERLKKGWTKTETAKRLNIAGSTYSSYEYGHRRPDDEMLVKLSRLFGVSVDYLLDNDKQPGIDYFSEAEAIMFKDIEGFDELPIEKQEEIKNTINEQIEFLIHKEKKR